MVVNRRNWRNKMLRTAQEELEHRRSIWQASVICVGEFHPWTKEAKKAYEEVGFLVTCLLLIN